MLRALRQMKETVSVASTSSGADADDRKTVTEISDAATTLKRTLTFYYKSFLDHNSNTAALHEDIANLYPASEKLSVAVATLNQGGNIFHDSVALVDEMKSTIEAPLDGLIAMCASALKKIDRRAFVRAEIEHYKGKIVSLANDAKTGGDAKKEAKAESNQQKLAIVQKEFRELEEELQGILAKLDADVARTINGSVASYMQMMTNYSNGMLHCFGTALAAIPGASGPLSPGRGPATL